MKIGKLPNFLLNELIIKQVKKQSPPMKEVLAGPSIGEDCALLDFFGDDIVVSGDPITATEDNIGRLLVTVCVNDVAASGGSPVGIMVTALIPPSSSEADIKKVMDDLLDEANKQNIAVLGGHTEITDAVNRIVLSGVVLGRVEKGGFIKTDGARAGDKIVMTKSAGLEGAAILAGEFEQSLSLSFGIEFVNRAKKYSEMTSIVKEAAISKEYGASSMHDITEGGLLGALTEASQACGFGFAVDLRKAALYDEIKKICGFFGINPFELISSGSLLITVKDGEGLARELKKNGVEAAVIGEVTIGDSYIIDIDGKKKPLSAPQADAIYDALRYEEKKQVVFVCTGNTCRSPMAEGFANSLADECGNKYSFVSKGLFAGTGGASENSILAMKEKGIDISEFVSSPFTEGDAENAFLILTMTDAHKKLILERFAHIDGIIKKTFTLREYAYQNGGGDVADPFGHGVEDYRNCCAEIEECIKNVLKRLNTLY